MRVDRMTAFVVGLAAATVTSGLLDAVMEDGEGPSAQARAARSSAEPAPTPSTESPDTPSPTPTPTLTEEPASADEDPGGTCVPMYHVPLPEWSPVVDPKTGLTTFKKSYETPEPVEYEHCLSDYRTSYDYSYSLPDTAWQNNPPTNAPGYPPGFGDSGSEAGTERDRRVPITTERGGMPDLAPTVPRAPAPRVPAFIP